MLGGNPADLTALAQRPTADSAPVADIAGGRVADRLGDVRSG